MCWKYEVFYEGCFDHFDGACGDNEGSITLLLQQYGVEIVDFGEFRGRVGEFLTRLHDDGVIKPADDIPRPTEKEVKKWFNILVRRNDGKDVYTEYIRERKEKGLDTFIGDNESK